MAAKMAACFEGCKSVTAKLAFGKEVWLQNWPTVTSAIATKLAIWLRGAKDGCEPLMEKLSASHFQGGTNDIG